MKTNNDLTFIALFSLIFSAVMGSGVFDIPQNISHQAGLKSILIGWIIIAVGMLAIGWIFVYLTSHRSDITSGIYGYARHGFGKYIGFNSALGYWLNSILGNASYLIYVFATLGNFAFFNLFGDGINIYSLIVESILIWFIYWLILIGIREALIVNTAITILKLLALVAIIIAFIYGLNYHRLMDNFLTSTVSMPQVKSTMLVTVWDFLGIEAACIYAMRARHHSDIARATIYGVIAVLCVDFLISVLPFGILNADIISHLATPSTTGVLYAILPISSSVVKIMIVISVLGALLSWSMLAINIMFVAAHDGTLSHKFTHLNKNGVPHRALFISMLSLQLFILCAYFTNSVYLAMIQLATSLILVPYFLSALFACKLIITDKQVNWIALIKGVIAVTYSLWLVYAGGLKYIALSTLLYGAGTIYYIIMHIREGRQVFTSAFEKMIAGLLTVAASCTLIFWYHI